MEESKQRIKFDKALLDECIKRDGASLIGEYEKISGTSIIQFKCKCSINTKKKLRQLCNVSGAYCSECVYRNAQEKQKKTNIEKYGVEYPQQNKEIRKKTIGIFKEKYGISNPSQNQIFQQKKIETNIQKFGVEWASQSEEVKEKIKITNIEKYGVENPNQNNIVREKIKKTNLLKYGVEHPLQNENILEKTLQTNLEKYGVKNPMQNQECKKKSIETSRAKYGVDYPFQSQEVKQKQRNTMFEKYGVEYNSQSQEIREKQQKNAKKYKEYKMPSGEIRKVQGYEPFALDALIKTYTEDQIKTDRKDVPRIQYKIDDKNKYYFPDIFIPHENKLIEVKSTWTYKCKTDNIQLKANSCKEQGYNYEIWCYDAKGKRIEV